MHSVRFRSGLCVFLEILLVHMLWAEVYEVGPGRAFANIGDVPWESLAEGDTVRVHWRALPYREKWVICRTGTEARQIVVSGVPNPDGRLPVVDGRDATTIR